MSTLRKKRKFPKKDSSFMNSELRKAICKKTKMLHNKYNKYKSKTNWEMYRKQRNYAAKLRKQSLKLYFSERRSGGQVEGMLAYHKTFSQLKV